MKKSIETCPLCGYSQIKVIYSEMHDKNYFIKGKFSLIKCVKCRVEFVFPQLNEKELVKYYPPDYYSFNKKSILATIYHKISAYYHSKSNLLFNIIFYPFSSLLYTYYIDKNSKGKKLLEVGCGRGASLRIYRAYGIKTWGLEPYGKKLTKEEKKLCIRRQSVKEANFRKNSFDYIVMKEVLEHIPNQELALMKCLQWLKPEGEVIITVPNTQSLWNKIFKENWYGYDIPRHVFMFNKKNLSFLLKKLGFNVKKARIYDLPYMLDGSIKFYLYDKKRKKNPGMLFSGFSKVLFTPLSLIVTYLKQGSILEINATKPKNEKKRISKN